MDQGRLPLRLVLRLALKMAAAWERRTGWNDP